MKFRAAKVDSNQNELVKALRDFGCSVYIVSMVKGFVDIIVGYNGVNYLFEIKTKTGKVSEIQKRLHATWRGKIHVVRNIDDCLQIIKGNNNVES